MNDVKIVPHSEKNENLMPQDGKKKEVLDIKDIKKIGISLISKG
jgi:hypothetical protein